MVLATKLGKIKLAAVALQQELCTSPDGISVVFEDSIYRYYNRVCIDIKDPEALKKEAFLHANGVILDVSLIRETENNDLRFGCYGKFVIDASAYMVKKEDTNSANRGIIHLDLVNLQITKQKVHNRIFKGRISEIITQLCKEDGFILDGDGRNAVIMNCGNEDTWHQIGMTNAEFIQRVLLPNTYGALDLTPYFAWTNSRGEFFFQNLLNMSLASGVAKGELHLKLAIDAESGTGRTDTPLPKTNYVHNDTNPLCEIREWRKRPYPFSKQIKTFFRQYFNLDWITGDVSDLQDIFLSYPLNMDRKGFTHRPFGFPVSDDFLGGVALEHSSTAVGLKMEELAGPEFENHMGRRIYTMWQELLCDRYECTTPFFPQIKAGNAVIVGTMWKLSSDLRSATHTGLFIVESSRHGWDMNTQEPFSQFTLVRYGLDIDPNKLKYIPHLVPTFETKTESI